MQHRTLFVATDFNIRFRWPQSRSYFFPNSSRGGSEGHYLLPGTLGSMKMIEPNVTRSDFYGNIPNIFSPYTQAIKRLRSYLAHSLNRWGCFGRRVFTWLTALKCGIVYMCFLSQRTRLVINPPKLPRNFNLVIFMAVKSHKVPGTIFHTELKRFSNVCLELKAAVSQRSTSCGFRDLLAPKWSFGRHECFISRLVRASRGIKPYYDMRAPICVYCGCRSGQAPTLLIINMTPPCSGVCFWSLHPG